MSPLADLLEPSILTLVERWTHLIAQGIAPENLSQPVLRDHVAEVLRELMAALRQGEVPARVGYAQEHGRQRYRHGFSVDALVREYDVLRAVLLERAEQADCRLSWGELRVFSEFLGQAVSEGVAEYHQQRFRTEQKLNQQVHQSEEELRDLRLREREARAETQIERQRLRDLFQQAPVAIAILEGPEYLYTFTNAAYRVLIGDREVTGMTLDEGLPEMRAQGIHALLDRVMATGEAFVGREVPLQFTHLAPESVVYYDFTYSPMRDVQGRTFGVLVSASDVTSQVVARQQAEALAARLKASEERLRLVVESSGIGAWELDLSSRRIVADEVFCEMFGMLPGEPFDLDQALARIPVEDHGALLQALDEAIEGGHGGHYQVEHRIELSSGERPRWIEVRGQAFFDAEGRAVRLLGVGVDISSRKEVEAVEGRLTRHNALAAAVGLVLARSASLDRMLQSCAQALIDHLGAAFARFWLFNPQQNVLELTASAGLYTHLDGPHGRVQLGHFKIGRVAQERRFYFTNAVQGDDQVSDQAWAEREGMVAFAGYPLLVDDRLIGVMALFARHTIPVDTFEALQLIADHVALGIERLRAEQALRTRADFEQHLVGIVSHDLRTPLNAILLGATALLTRDKLDSTDLRIVSRMRSSVERAARMIRDLLDFTQARLGGGIPVVPRPADLHALVRQVLDEAEAAHPGRALQLHQEGDGHGEWDADRLAQVIGNLVTNALKYSPADSPIQVVSRRQGDEMLFSIHNQGPSIPPAKLASIFEPMQRATAEVDQAGRSVGLGLYIVKDVVRAHGGSVEVTSSEQEGTTFRVRLPTPSSPRPSQPHP